MKKYPIAIILALTSFHCFADQYVSPHIRNDGTYVEGYHRSSPNSSTYDNYSSKGNSNPYTGQQGYRQNEYSAPSNYGNSYGNSNSRQYGYGNYGNNR